MFSMISFFIYYMVGVSGPTNLPLKFALSIVYLFTGGYLLSPAMADFVILLCFIFTPCRDQSEDRAKAHSMRAIQKMASSTRLRSL